MFGPAPRAPTVGANPYQMQQGQFLEQLRAQSMPRPDGSMPPSVAEEEFKRRNAMLLQQQMAAARGRNPGGARQAAYAGSQATQGLNQAATQAGMVERGQNSQLYGQMLNQAGQLDFQRGNANLQAELAVMGMPSGMDKLMGAGVALGAAAL